MMSYRFSGWFAVAVFIAGLTVPRLNADEGDAVNLDNTRFSREHVEFFEKEVLPILQANCFSCHGGKPKVESKFRLTSRAGVLKGGELGAAIDRDKLANSQLLSAVNYEELEMPPKGQLPAAQIATLTKWVKLGLPWSKTADYGVAERKEKDRGDGRDYWAYQPIRRPAIPRVKRANWVRKPLDAFILARLEAAGLAPAPAAGKIALIRRAYYDLTGLPPTPAEVEAFLKDKSPQAFEKVIDRLLESSQYGERWGRHWLDLVRYAETHGYERDSPKPHAWRYRDYVIRSFNADKSYKQFVIEQLAGDELPDVTEETLTATGYYRLGLWDDEPADRELARYDGLDDILKTTSETVLATTMGCVRCHSHKVDPINHNEYYGFLSYFHDITHPNRENLRHFVSDEGKAEQQRRIREKSERENKLAAQLRQLEDEFRRGLKEQTGLEVGGKPGGMAEFILADSRKQPQTWEYTVETPSDDWMQPDYSTTSWKKGPGGFGTKGTPGSVVRTVWREGDIWLRQEFQLKSVPPYLALDIHHDEDCQVYLNGRLVHSAQGYLKDYQRVALPRKALKALREGRNVLAIHCRQTGGGQYIDAGLVAAKPRLELAAALREHGAKVIGREKVKQLADVRKQLEASRKQKIPPAGTPIMSVLEQGNRPVHILLRGNPHVRGDRVESLVPVVFRTKPPVVVKPKDSGTSGKRLAIARWMFQDDNPLTARVIANRLWHYHFGRGIVPTPNDFGKLGAKPTHPLLLDWLASEVRDGGWKLKRIHKLIMLSAAWQMSARAADAALAKDPGNTLFWRFNMRRLSSEELRDAMLAVTGELNLKQGGPSIYVPIPRAVLQGQSRPGAGWGKSPPEEAARRSVYIHVKRSLMVPILEMHDQADTDSSCPVRYVTTVPTQSLGMLNGEFTNERAAKLAARLRREAPQELRQQVARAIRLTTGREPTKDEIEADLKLIAELRQEDKLNADQALKMYCLLILNTNEFVYLD